MSNSFRDECFKVADNMRRDYGLSRAETLIWIYLNIYFIRSLNLNDRIYNKESFLKFINSSLNFKDSYATYFAIDELAYVALKRELLNEYSFHNSQLISLKGMEDVYESFLEEDVRDKTGSYYTPIPIVEFITHKSIIEFIKGQLKDEKVLIEEFLVNKDISLHMGDVFKVINILENIKIIDIACGGGVFLREAYKQLLEKLSTCYEYLGITYDRELLIKDILTKCIYGFDIQKNSVDICKILLLMNTSEEVKLNIKTNNALLLDKFTEFDIVLGNPPYIGEKGNKELFDLVKHDDFGKRYYEKGMDYFYFFIYKSYELLRQDGVLGYITTNYFVTADGAKKLRTFLKDNINFTWIINFDEISIFPRAKGQHNIIYIASKKMTKEKVHLFSLKNTNFKLNNFANYLKEAIKSQDEREYKFLHNAELYTNRGHILIQCDNKISLLNKIENYSNYILSDLCNVNQGIVSGADRDSSSGKGIFVLTMKELEELSLLEQKYSKLIKPFYKNSQIRKYFTVEKDDLFILYIDDHNLRDEEEYPLILAHLSKFKTILERRREVKSGARSWFALQWPRNENIFEDEKIVAPQRSLDNSFAYSLKPLYASADIYYITKKKDVSLPYILGVLNSSLMYYYLYNRGKRKGKYLELYATPLKNLPIAYKDDKRIKLIEKCVLDILHKDMDENLKKDIEMRIDSLVFEIYNLNTSDIKEIENFKCKQD